MDRSGAKKKATTKNLSKFEKFQQNVKIMLLQIFYRKPQHAVPVSRSLVCDNYTLFFEILGLIATIILMTKTKQTQIIVIFSALFAAFVVPSFMTKLGITATYYKIIVIWRLLIIPVSLIILWVVKGYFAAVLQVCNALKDYDSTTGDVSNEALELCESLTLSYITTFIVQFVLLLTRFLNIFFFFKGFKHLKKILMEKRLKKKRKLRYSNVQKRKEIMKKEGYYTYNQNRKL